MFCVIVFLLCFGFGFLLVGGEFILIWVWLPFKFYLFCVVCVMAMIIISTNVVAHNIISLKVLMLAF